MPGRLATHLSQNVAPIPLLWVLPPLVCGLLARVLGGRRWLTGVVLATAAALGLTVEWRSLLRSADPEQVRRWEQARSASGADGPLALRIVTWNVNSLNARLERVEGYLPAQDSPASRDIQVIPRLAREVPEVTECYRITGEDCYFMKLYLRTIDDLEPILDRFTPHGRTTTSIVHSAPVPPRPLPVLDQPDGGS